MGFNSGFKGLTAYQEVLQILRHSLEEPWTKSYVQTPFAVWMDCWHIQMICIANLYDCCKCLFYTVLFLYICVFYDMFHIPLSFDSLRDSWNVYCIV